MQEKFSAWLDEILKELKVEGICAFNFNLYEEYDEDSAEDTDSEIFAMQIIGAETYYPDNDDWACFEIFSSEENLFVFNEKSWEDALKHSIIMVKDYLTNGKYKSVLLSAKAVAVGFVDGDLERVYEK